jgi:hypothetical protein
MVHGDRNVAKMYQDDCNNSMEVAAGTIFPCGILQTFNKENVSSDRSITTTGVILELLESQYVSDTAVFRYLNFFSLSWKTQVPFHLA